MIYRIRVWERGATEHRPVGEMVCEISENGRSKGAFRYDKEYLQRDDAFALDPVSLPLRAESFTIDHPGIFGVFDDSLPDDWGRRLLIRMHNIPRHNQNPPNLLLALGSAGLGSLSYSVSNHHNLPASDVSIRHLSELVVAAEMFERGEIHDTELSLLLGACSSPGGSRPKAVVFNEESNTHYIAKFPSINDVEDVVKIEAATMKLAAKAGLEVPPTELVQCANKSILLVRRFDILPEGRRHMVSFQALLKAQGYYQHRYQDLLGIIRKFSSDPLEDSKRLYRQMVFNAVIGNTDDHLKNFWMLYDQAGGWRFSPSFDLVPDIGRRGEHVLFFDLGAYYPGRKTLENLGRRWGIHNSESIMAQVFEVVADWKEEFARAGISETDIHRFKEIDLNLI